MDEHTGWSTAIGAPPAPVEEEGVGWSGSVGDDTKIIDELTDRARAKAAAVTLATVELVDAIAALAPYEGRISATARQWVSWRCGLTTAETRRLFRLVDKLGDLPLLDAAFRSGALSDDVVGTLATIATPENEATLIDAAADATGAQLAVLVRDYRAAQRSEAEDQRRRRDDNSVGTDDDDDPDTAPSAVWWRWDDDGRHRGGWDLRSDEGARLEAALEAELARLQPTEEEVDADGDVAAGGGATGSASDPEHAGSHDANHTAGPGGHSGHSGHIEGELRPEERARVRRCDALIGLADTYLANTADDDGMLPESHQIIIRHDLRGHAAATLEGSGTLARWISEMCACDSIRITQDMIDGFPVSEPTMQRSFTTSQRRALRARDRHCRFPGCPRRWHLHAHHTQEWQHTHRSSVAHAVLLCNQHHTLIHLRGHTITLEPDGTTTVHRSDGTTLRSRALPAPPPHQCRPPETPPPERRLTGLAEPLTYDARSTMTAHWLKATRTSPRSPDG